MSMINHFDNPRGFALEEDHWQRACGIPYKLIYEFTLEPDSPLTYISADGTAYQPDRHFLTDMGSVPRTAQLLIPKDRFRGFYLHDSAYRHKGLWIKLPTEKHFYFVRMSRREADDLLYEMCLADPEPAWHATARAIWLAVRAGGWAGWGKSEKPASR